MKKLYPLLLIMAGLFVASARQAFAHCPLCTVGAAAAAGGAVFLGVSKGAVAIFIGAFGVSTGWWVANMLKKEFVPFQKPLIVVVSFLGTVIPISPLLTETKGLYIPWIGTYGLTYPLNTYYFGALLGGLVVCITPFLSKKITEMRMGKKLPFQGIALTFILLLIVAGVLEIAV